MYYLLDDFLLTNLKKQKAILAQFGHEDTRIS